MWIAGEKDTKKEYGSAYKNQYKRNGTMRRGSIGRKEENFFFGIDRFHWYHSFCTSLEGLLVYLRINRVEPGGGDGMGAKTPISLKKIMAAMNYL